MSVKLRKKKLADGTTSLYLDVYVKGNRHYEFLNLYISPKDKLTNKDTLQLAENVRSKRQLEIQNNEYGFVPHFKKKANFVEYFVKLTKNRQQRAGTWRSVAAHLTAFTRGRISFSAITEEWLESFKAYLLSKLAQSTAHIYFIVMRTALKQAVKDKILITNPAAAVSHIKQQDTQREFLTFEEIQTLNSAYCRYPEVKRAFLFACYTGLRYSDIFNLTWQNINKESIDFRQQKTKTVEYLPLSPTARKILYSHNEGILNLPTRKIFQLPAKSTMNVTIREWRMKAGLTKNVTFHTSRHTFATLSLSQGIDLYTVSKLLGHKDIGTTQIYAKISDTKKRDAVAMLPAIEVSL